MTVKESPSGLAVVENDIKVVKQIEGELNALVVERDVPIHMMWLSVIARVHGAMIGSAGIAKSMLTDNLCARITGIEYYSEQFRKSLPPEAIIGNVSAKGLLEDEFRYVTKGGITVANIANADELWKANGVVLNILLKIVNERMFKNNGVWLPVPLWALFGTSNELPTDPELMAIRDRFGWTIEVEPVKTDEGFKEILRGQVGRNAGTNGKGTPTTIDKEAIERLQEAARAVTVDEAILNDLANLRRQAEAEANIYASPRRYGEGVRLMQAEAISQGRDHVISDDIALFQHVLWTDLEDKPKAAELTLGFAGQVAKASADLRPALDEQIAEIKRVKREFDAAGNRLEASNIQALTDVNIDITVTREKIEGHIADAKAANREHTELDAMLDEIAESKRLVASMIV